MTVQYSLSHPHEPEIPPILDAEGRCLICSLLIERIAAVARANQLEQALTLAVETAEVLNEALRQAVSENLLSVQAAGRIESARVALAGVPAEPATEEQP